MSNVHAKACSYWQAIDAVPRLQLHCESNRSGSHKYPAASAPDRFQPRKASAYQSNAGIRPVVFPQASHTLAIIVGGSTGRKIHYDLQILQHLCSDTGAVCSIAKTCMGMHEDVFNNLL